MRYERPIPFTGAVAHRRIYSPFAYPQVVDVVLPEASRMAAWFPVVWHRADGRPIRLVVVRSLLEDGRGQPPGIPSDLTALPLVLNAYPFLLDLSRKRPRRR